MKSAEFISPDIEETASDWIARRDAGLTAAESTALAEWLAADARHPEALARHERTWSVFQQKLSSDRARAMAGELQGRGQRRRRLRMVNAMAVITVLSITSYFWQNSQSPVSDLPAPTHAVVVLPKHQILPDGSRVEWRNDAAITIDFSGSLRRVVLAKSDAYFEVVPDPARPFVVEAGGVEVRAVGTAFSVEVGPKQVDVLVTHGRVSVASPTAPPIGAVSSAVAPGRTLSFVDAGSHLVVDISGARQPIAAVPISTRELSDRLAWRSPRLDFTGTPLSEAVRLMNRFNRVKFVIGDPSIASLEVSGYFRADNVATFARLIEETVEVKADRQGDIITLCRVR